MTDKEKEQLLKDKNEAINIKSDKATGRKIVQG